MLDIINYFKGLISTSTVSRKRRSPIEEFDIHSPFPKIRRLGTSMSSPEEDWQSFSSSESLKRRSANNTSLGIKPRTGWSKENVTVTIDDDDDILETNKSKTKPFMDSLKNNKPFSFSSSTPNNSNARRNSHQNKDDDVVFLKKTPSADEKKRNSFKNGFDYIATSQYLSELQNRSSITNNFERSISNTAKEAKAKILNMNQQSYRLDEKAKYKMLLSGESTNTKLCDSFSKYSTSNRKPSADSRGKRLVDMALLPESKRKNSNFIDLTMDGGMKKFGSKLSTRDTIKKVLGEFEEPIVVKDSDSDVEMLPTPPSPKPDIHVEPVNSLKKIIDLTETTQEGWLKNLVQKYQNDVAKYMQEICAQTAQKKKLSEVTSEVCTKRLEEQMVKCLKIKDAILPVTFKEETVLPELSHEDESRIDYALAKRSNPNEVLSQKFNLSITRHDIQTLSGLNWLNDEVINFYMNLIIERGKLEEWPKAYAMNTFFYPKLLKDGQSGLRRWTKRVDLFSYDIIAIPIHLGVHWCMSIIDFRAKTIKYYDSMGSTNRKCLESLLKYLQAEHLDKKNKEYQVADWSLECAVDIPQQMNGSDCGMFSCTFAEFLTRGAKITFNQENMPYLRRKMVLEILNGQLMIT